MTTATIPVIRNEEGFLLDPNDWTPEIAQAIAAEEGIAELSERHWDVINFARADHEATGESPTLRRISKQSGVTTKELFKLFPKGPAKKISKSAGLDKPKGCV
ncbi:MAG: TusE/DsrC/DsvC family sulfur relay protein [bacterium]|nr:TusE/DsrC/DsvC family sulfur relay protein [bacterium]